MPKSTKPKRIEMDKTGTSAAINEKLTAVEIELKKSNPDFKIDTKTTQGK